MVLNFLKVTAYVKIPAICYTLAEKHITDILKNASPFFCRILYICRGQNVGDQFVWSGGNWLYWVLTTAWAWFVVRYMAKRYFGFYGLAEMNF
jgi:hypothetical protein